ncbi:MAG TPA: nucleotidyltransferase family protein, partial [Thermoanaerobaculia bacterium]|nr:nucleotidyltransferase family protein [Thermoanaerobaculia bacterium]
MDSAVARRIARELALVQSQKIGPHVFHGATMLPFLVDGDEVSIEPVTFDQIRPGDVVTYRDQQYFPTRRVIRIDRRSRSLILKGDAIPHLTFFVLEEDVLGRATSIVRGERRSSASDAEWRETAEAIVARERRRARTAWLPDWLGLGPDAGDHGVPAPEPGATESAIGDPWWRTGRAAVDLDALQVVRALLAGAPDRAAWTLSRMKARRFLDFARENGIAGDLVVLAQDAGGGVSAVFDPIIAELIESARRQRQVNRRVLAHLDEVAEIFERRGIESILLKGPHLSLGYYGSLDQRRMGDLDLLVRRRDLRAASAALVEGGYASRTGAPLGMAATLRFVHHLEHEKDGVPVDLHHQIRVHPTFRLDEEEMWRTAGRLDLGSRTVRVLSDHYVLVTLILSIHNDVGLGTADLHPFFDLDRVLARVGDGIDWKEFFAARRRERAETIAANVLALHTLLMGGARRHSALSAEIESRAESLVLEPRRRAYVELIQGASLAAKKRWAFEQLETSLSAATLWWLLGLPVHALVYR